jgi:hypothetical protein
MMIARGLEEAREDVLAPGAVAAAVGLVAAFAISLVIAIVSWSASRQRGPALDAASSSSPSPAATTARLASQRSLACWLAAGACLLAASVLFADAQSARAENEAPWPQPPRGVALHLAATTPTPDVEGPDPLDPVPFVVSVSDRHLELEGAPVDEAQLEQSLGILRQNYRLLHPGDAVDERLVIVCPRDLDPRRLAGPLAAAARAGYRRPVFGVGRPEAIVRPVLGTYQRRSWRGVEVLAADADSEEPSTQEVLVPLTAHPTCGALVAAAARLRREATWPRLVLPHDPAPGR